MADKNSIGWQKIILVAAEKPEIRYRIKLVIDGNILFEINQVVKDDIARLGFKPNVAKFAGLIAYWISGLKPASIDPESPNYY